MQLILPYSIKEKMRLYVESLDNEISGFGKIEFNQEEDTCTIIDIKIFEQEVSSARSELEGENIAKFATELVKNGETLGGWNLWWHSHNDMGVFWSGTDTGTMDENPLDAPFMVSIVTNNDGEYKARIDLYEPTHMYLDDIKVITEYPQDNSLKKEIEKEVKELVSQPKPATLITTGKNYSAHWDKKKKEWIDDIDITDTRSEIGNIHESMYTQMITNEELEERALYHAEKHTLQELEAALDMAEEDSFTTFDEFSIIEYAIEIKSEEEEIKKEDNSLNKKDVK